MPDDRPPLPPIGLSSDEPATLTHFLDHYRAVLARKCWGLRQDQLAQTLHPSGLCLGGLLKHMSLVEDWWFDHRLLGNPEVEPWASAPFATDPDWDMHSAAADSPAELYRQFGESCERSRRAIVGLSLEHPSVLTNPAGQHWNLRWIMVHMIEEYARHCGHADLLREAVDGATGD
jgi:Protein of unknown function (DUF664)